MFLAEFANLLEVLLAEIASFRANEGVQLCEEGDCPHQVAADDGEDERRSPHAEEADVSNGRRRPTGREGDLHLVLALGRKHIRRGAHAEHDEEADEDGVPVTVFG